MNTPRGDLLYVAGPAAAGKSTLLDVLTLDLRRSPFTTPVPRELLYRPDTGDVVAVEIGRRVGAVTALGSDALGGHQHPAACTYVGGDLPYRLVLAEGDRLATCGFVAAAADAGYRVTVAHLDIDVHEQVRRIGDRARDLPVSYLKGRATKARLLAEYAEQQPGMRTVRLDGTQPPELVAKHLVDAVPVLARLAA